MENAMPRTLQKKIRIPEEQWKRLESEAAEHDTTANRLVVDLAIEALNHRKWPRTELEIRMLRSALFTAQATARKMIAEGREHEVEEIRRDISRLVPSLPTTSTNHDNSPSSQPQHPLRKT
ncbi:MAG: hypothetical protein OXQ89_10490 [Rhodospirillaceae bacterium]|nr:hypothetical protein [Rhodospirillaceae bacterium]